MASKRDLRRKAWEGKGKHSAEADAERAARAVRLHAYRCPHCNGFHVGHPEGRVKQGLAAKRRHDEFRRRMQTLSGAR